MRLALGKNAQAKLATKTTYRVLKFPAPQNATSSSSVTNGYQDVGSVAATNAFAAIKILAEKAGAGTYVAVPDSSWKPVTVTVETQTVIRVT